VVTFSEALNRAGVNNLSFSVTRQAHTINIGDPNLLPQEDKTVVFRPTAELQANTRYIAHILKTVQSEDKKNLENDESWAFNSTTTYQEFVQLSVSGYRYKTLMQKPNFTRLITLASCEITSSSE
jgi:Bacterial Ig-like domain